jgi:hypothetical protein
VNGRLDPARPIPGLGRLTIGDFWSWAYSDVLSNTTRSVYAEFLVAAALDVIAEPRLEWDAVDLRYRGHAIEVKAAAYLQSWPQRAPSPIRFDIAKKRAWDARTNISTPHPVRAADVYVFCLYTETDPGRNDVLDPAGWDFYVLPTACINAELGDQKSISLSRLEALARPIGYEELAGRIRKALAG